MKPLIFLLFLICPLISSARLVERVQAQVAGEMISFMDLKNFQTKLKTGLVPPSLLLTQFFTKAEILKDKNVLLDFMIYRVLLAQLAEKAQLPNVSDEQITKTISSLKESSPKKNFSKKLAAVGETSSSLKQDVLIDIKNDLLLHQSIASKVIISEQDIESYHFNKYKEPLFKSFEYEFILASFPEKKKKDIFKKLSKIQIKDLKKTAQALGLEYKNLTLKQKDLQKDFKKELDGLSISQVSSLLLSQGSYYLLQLKWKTPQVKPEEQKRRMEIEQALYKKRLKEEIKKWLYEKKKAFLIHRHPL